jgi:glycosyltransferase involved in cell wall biosynthesis
MTHPPSSKQKICVVFYHGNDWDGVRARQRYLMQALSEHFRVIYLNGSKPKEGWLSVQRVTNNLVVVGGLAPLLGALERRGLQWFARLIGRGVAALCRRRGETLVFWNAENWLRPYRFIPYAWLVYDCIDPSFSVDEQRLAAFEARESEVLGAADLVFASASALVERCLQENSKVHLLNNACEPAEFDPVLLAETPCPTWWPQGDLPVAAYLGSLDRRFDFDMVRAAAEHAPGVYFVLAGHALPECEAQVDQLRKLPNISCPGIIDVKEGCYLVAKCAVGLIPFRVGATNDGVNPVKLYMFAFLGKQIVGTAIRELVERPEIVAIGKSPDEFAAHVLNAATLAVRDGARETNRSFARRNTWRERADTVAEIFACEGISTVADATGLSATTSESAIHIKTCG